MPAFFSNTLRLLNDALTWIIALIPTSVIIFVAYQSWLKSVTEEEAVIQEKNRNIKRSIVAGAIGLSASGLIKLILSYYQ